MSCVTHTQHWSSITTHLLVVGSQLEVAQYTYCPLTLGRGGVVALAEAHLLQHHDELSLFLPNLPSGRPLAGGCGGVWRTSYSHTSYSPALAPPASVFPSH